jgi:hypothetical protein
LIVTGIYQLTPESGLAPALPITDPVPWAAFVGGVMKLT